MLRSSDRSADKSQRAAELSANISALTDTLKIVSDGQQRGADVSGGLQSRLICQQTISRLFYEGSSSSNQ